MKQIYVLWLAVLPLITAIQCTTPDKPITDWVQHDTKGYLGNQDLLKQYTNIQRHACETECNKFAKCVAISYKETPKECRLSKRRASDPSADFKEDDAWQTRDVQCFSGTTARPSTPIIASQKTHTTTSPPTTPPPTSSLCNGTVTWFSLPSKDLDIAGNNIKVHQASGVSTKAECQNKCLQHSRFVCRSVNYKNSSTTLECNLYDSPDSAALATINVKEDADGELNILVCTDEQLDFCEATETAEWRTSENTAKEQNLQGFIRVQGLTDLRECQRFCAEWTSFSCSFVDYTISSEPKACTLWETTQKISGIVTETGTTFSQRTCRPTGLVEEAGESTTLNLALKPEYIVLIGMGCVVIALITIIVVVIATSSRKS